MSSNLIILNIFQSNLPYSYHLVTYHLNIMHSLDILLIDLDLFIEIELKHFFYYCFIHHYLMMILLLHKLQKLFRIQKTNLYFSNKNHKLLLNTISIIVLLTINLFNLVKSQHFNLFVIN